MFKKMSIKNKTLLFVMISLIVFSFTLFFTIYTNQKNKLAKLENEYYFNMKKSYSKTLEKHKEFYKYRLLNIVNLKGVKEAFYQQDRKRLYDIVKPQFDMLKKENEYFKIMHFHLPNGNSFLRVHKPEMFGDNIASRRAMAAAMHQQQKGLDGFEAGIYMLAYREFTPVFYQDKYLGSVELGSRPDQVLYYMDYFSSIKGALFIKENKIIEYKEKSDLKIKEYTLQYNGLNDKKLIKFLPKDYDFSSKIEITKGDKTYAVYPFDMLDYDQKISAKAVYFHDISHMKNAFENTLKQLAWIIFGLLTILVFVINLGFSKIILAVEQINEKLKNTVGELDKNKIFTDSILKNSAHAIITTDTQGTITLFNKRAEELLEYTSEELVAKKTPAIFHRTSEVIQRAKEYSAEFNKEIAPGFDVFIAKTNEGIENSDEWIYVDKNGFEFPVSLHITALTDLSGEVIGYLGIAEDITIKKILEKELEDQKKELETIFDTTKDGIAMLDLETNFLFFNNAYLKMTGFSKEELYTKSCAGLSAPEDISRAQEVVAEAIEKGFVENFEKTCIVKDDRKLKINMSISLMPDKQRLLIAVKDITRLKERERLIEEYLNLIDKNIITSSTDLEGHITYVSKAFCQISGYSEEELIGKTHRIIKHDDTPISTFESLWKNITNNKNWQGEIKNRKKDGGYYWVEANISPIYNEVGDKIGYTAIRQDITDKKMIELISITDGLTNIFNRRHFNEVFPKFINSAKRKDELVSFIIMDIDHFKQYNDTYGHQMGDEVLIKVSSTIKGSLQRADDYCFRLGGEEFGVVFKADSKDKAEDFANTIRQNIEDLHVKHSGNSVSPYVTISMGLVCKKASEIISDDLVFKEADDLLYEAKKTGRNRVISNKRV